MKFPVQIQFHRPEFLKSDDNPKLKALFHKDKDNPVDANNNSALRAQASKQQDRANRYRLFGGLVTFSHRNTKQTTVDNSSKEDANENGHLSSVSTPEITQWSEGHISDSDIKAHFKNLASKLAQAWPRDWPKAATNEPPAFVELANEYQAEKEALFARANGTPDRLQIALACANILHAKEGHNENVVSVTSAFLKDEKIEATFNNDPTSFITMAFGKEQFNADILSAAKWHGLSDRDIPVSVLAAKRAPSPEDKAKYIDLRSGDSAQIYEEYGLPKGDVSALIRQTRVFGEESKQRLLAAQFLDLMDRISAMGAKPFFKTNGKADAEKIFSAIDKDLEKNNVYISPDLKNAVKTCVEKGQLDAALLAAREENTYVRA